MQLNGFTREQLAGQRLMVGFDGVGLNSDLEYLIGDLKVGGIILFSRNVSHPEQINALCTDVQAYAKVRRQPPLFIAIDQEGGQVARLKEPFTLFPGNPSMVDENDAERFARITAAELKSVGINMNLAPVMDVAYQGTDSVMTQRAFGADPVRVSRLGCSVIDHLQQNGIMAVAKHFPGIGRTTVDSHLNQPVLDIPMQELEATDLKPFAAAISHKVAGIMLSHILYAGIDDRWPAGMSARIALGLLRNRMGYDGVVMTDDLDMGSIKGRYDLPIVIRRVIASEVDLALICHKGPDIEQGFREMLEGIGRSPDTAAKALASVKRIMALKKEYVYPTVYGHQKK